MTCTTGSSRKYWMKSARPRPASLPVEIQHETGTPRASKPPCKWLPRPPLCATMATAPLVPARKRGVGCGEKKTRGKPIDEVHVAEAIRPDESEATGACDLGDALLLADTIAAKFSEPRRKDHRSRDLAPHATFDRLAYACCR